MCVIDAPFSEGLGLRLLRIPPAGAQPVRECKRADGRAWHRAGRRNGTLYSTHENLGHK